MLLPRPTCAARLPSGESPGADLLAEWLVNQAVVNATWTTLNGGGLGVEIKAAQ